MLRAALDLQVLGAANLLLEALLKWPRVQLAHADTHLALLAYVTIAAVHVVIVGTWLRPGAVSADDAHNVLPRRALERLNACGLCVAFVSLLVSSWSLLPMGAAVLCGAAVKSAGIGKRAVAVAAM